MVQKDLELRLERQPQRDLAQVLGVARQRLHARQVELEAAQVAKVGDLPQIHLVAQLGEHERQLVQAAHTRQQILHSPLVQPRRIKLEPQGAHILRPTEWERH
eukprot:7377075-Prymnesium_polylepis.1